MIPNYVLVRQLCGVWFALDALHLMTHARVWLGDGMDVRRWWTSRPFVSALLVGWVALSLALIVGFQTWIASVGLVVLFRHFYIAARWRSLLRGIGAVGFMPYWTALALAVLETALASDRAAELAPAFLRMVRVDFAVIFLCAGTYKALTGYVRGEGLEYALANPIWCWAFEQFRRLNPRSQTFKVADLITPLGQVGIGVLLLLPLQNAQVLGAVLAVISFLSLGVLFRIGRLGLLMGTIPLLFLPDLGLSGVAHGLTWHASDTTVIVLVGVSWVYLALLPIVKVVQYVNLFLDRALPWPFQRWLEWYAGLVPIIIWRVFSVDITNFFVRVFEIDVERESELVGERTVYNPWSWRSVHFKTRFLFVGESVAIAALFNTQKHFPSNVGLFSEKLLRYARSLPGTGVLRFEYVLIEKGERAMEFRPIVSYYVDRVVGVVREDRLATDKTPATTAKFSPIREAAGYGSYVRKV